MKTGTEDLFLSTTEPLSPLRGRKVTVMGLGLFGGGKGVTEFLCRHGARVTVTDTKSPADLAPVMAQVEELPIRWVLSQHNERDFLDADLVIPSPAVPRSHPLLDLCRRRGTPLETEMNLFFKHCRGKICAVTGSNGKTTTTSLIGAMARERWPTLRVGGNLGLSLLPEVESIAASEWVVLELSSFQLEDLTGLPRRPDVAVITNLSPNHLDRHHTYKAYADSKRAILSPSSPGAVAILNAEDAVVRTWASQQRSTIFFGRTASVLPSASGVWVPEDSDNVFLSQQGQRTNLFNRRDLALPGQFNIMNAAAAAGAAYAMGVEPRRIAKAVRGFRAVEHRLEPVIKHAGVSYLNDSIATTPESTIAALEALGPNVVVICGGSSKGCSFHSLGQALSRRTRGVVLLGQTAETIRTAIPCRPGGPRVSMAGTLEDAVCRAREVAKSGDKIILSPACPSYDMFVNFVERGDRFKKIARELPQKDPG